MIYLLYFNKCVPYINFLLIRIFYYLLYYSILKYLGNSCRCCDKLSKIITLENTALDHNKLAIGFNDDQARLIFDEFDKDKSGTLDDKEATEFFRSYCKSKAQKGKQIDPQTMNKEIQRLKDLFDTDGNGSICYDELIPNGPMYEDTKIGPHRRVSDRSKAFFEEFLNAYENNLPFFEEFSREYNKGLTPTEQAIKTNIEALKVSLDKSKAPLVQSERDALQPNYLGLFELFNYPPKESVSVHGTVFSWDPNTEWINPGTGLPVQGAHVFQEKTLFHSYGNCIEKILTSRDFVICLCRVQLLPKDTVLQLCRHVLLGSIFPVRSCLEFSKIFDSMKDISEFHLFSDFSQDFNDGAIRLFESISTTLLASWVLDDRGYFQSSPWKLCLDPDTKNSSFLNTARVKSIVNLWYHYKTISHDTLETDDKSTITDVVAKVIQEPLSSVYMPDFRFYLSGFSMILFTIMFSANTVKKDDPLQFFDFFILLLGFGYIIQESLQLKKNMKQYFKSVWNYMDAILVVCFFISGISRFIGSEAYYVSNAFIVLFLWLRLFQLMTFNATMGPLIVAVIQMGTDVFNFLLLMVFFVFGFTFAFNQALLGIADDNKEGYESIQSIMFTLVRNGLGGDASFDLADGVDNDTQMLLIIFLVFFYLVVSAIILINMLVAMMGLTYSSFDEKKEEEATHVALVTKSEYIDPGIGLPPPLNVLTFFVIVLSKPLINYYTQHEGHNLEEQVYCSHCFTPLRITKRPKYLPTQMSHIDVWSRDIKKHTDIQLAKTWIESHVCSNKKCARFVKPHDAVVSIDVEWRWVEIFLVIIFVDVPVFALAIVLALPSYFTSLCSCFVEEDVRNELRGFNEEDMNPDLQSDTTSNENSSLETKQDDNEAAVEKASFYKFNFPDDSEVEQFEKIFPKSNKDEVFYEVERLESKIKAYHTNYQDLMQKFKEEYKKLH